jgi:uncharacterized protein YbjT (DUF2867 family)
MATQTQGKAKTILVTGATGQQGGAVAHALLAAGHKVRAFTRNAAKADALRGRGVEVHVGDFERPETVEKAARGADAAFIVATPFEKGPEAETRQAIGAIDACKRAGVPFIVYSSVGDADKDTGIPHFDSKRRVEEHLEQLGVPYAIVAPVFFRENLQSPWMAPALQQGTLPLALPGDRGLQSIDLREIGQFSAKVLTHPTEFHGQRIDLASDESTPNEMARAIEEAGGPRVRHTPPPLDQVRKQSQDQALMWEWFDKVGYSADIASLRRSHPDVQWRTFSDWARDAWAPSRGDATGAGSRKTPGEAQLSRHG